MASGAGGERSGRDEAPPPGLAVPLFPPEIEPGLLLGSLFQWQTQERLGDKLMYIWIRTFLPTVKDWDWVSLPDSRYWLYYFLRPWRLFSQGVLSPLRQRFSRKQ